MTEELLAALKEYIGNDVDRLDDDVLGESYRAVIREYIKECPVDMPWTGEVVIMQSDDTMRVLKVIELTDDISTILDEADVLYE